jgi:hypothetical protein
MYNRAQYINNILKIQGIYLCVSVRGSVRQALSRRQQGFESPWGRHQDQQLRSKDQWESRSHTENIRNTCVRTRADGGIRERTFPPLDGAPPEADGCPKSGRSPVSSRPGMPWRFRQPVRPGSARIIFTAGSGTPATPQKTSQAHHLHHKSLATEPRVSTPML